MMLVRNHVPAFISRIYASVRRDHQHEPILFILNDGRSYSTHSSSIEGFRLDGNPSTGCCGYDLQLEDRHENLLPALQKLYILQPGPGYGSLREVVVSLMVLRRLSGPSHKGGI
jgi:hypothetical protein